jgi:hypothetical protein
MNNQIVIVRDFLGNPLVRRVYGADAKRVYITMDTSNPRAPIGFPRKDVFFYDKKHLLELRANFKAKPSLWNNLTVWSETNNERK